MYRVISSEAHKGGVERSHGYEISRFADSLEMTGGTGLVEMTEWGAFKMTHTF